MRKNALRMTIGMCMVLTVICAANGPMATAQKQKDLPVTSTIADGAFQIQSDDQGPYTNTKAVQSIIQPIGDWVLNTNYSSLSTRSIYLEFSQPAPGSPNPPFSAELVKARLITQCPASMLSLVTSGAFMECGLVTHFTYGADSYRLAMNPGGVNGYVDTDSVRVTCLGATNGQCNSWGIEPAAASGMNVAKLLLLTTARGKTVATDLGKFYMSFAISVTNP